MKNTYTTIFTECEAIKLRMSLRVKDVNRINECLGKKNYYLQLKSQAAPYLHSQDDQARRLWEAKRELAHYLRSFA